MAVSSISATAFPPPPAGEVVAKRPEGGAALSPLSRAARDSSPAGGGTSPSAEAIAKTAKDFEAMVIAQMLQPMFESLSSDGLFGGGQGEEMFRPMLVEQYARKLSATGGIGIADPVRREMLRLQMGDGATHAAAG